MRINLNCPYLEKDAAKSLGARWDGAKRTWFIEDIEDLTPFLRWIKPSTNTEPKSSVPKPRVDSKKMQGTTSSAVQHCGCYHVLPWEDCEHTDQLADEAMHRILNA